MIALLLAIVASTGHIGSCLGASDTAKTCTLTFSTATSNGNDVLVGINTDASVGLGIPVISSVVDSGGSSYTPVTSKNANGVNQYLYKANSITASTTLTVTATCAGCTGCTGNTGCVFLSVVAAEYSGVGAYGLTNTGSVTTAATSASIAITTQAANSWVVGVSGQDIGGAVTTATGTQRVTVNGGGAEDSVTLSDNTSASAGSVSISWSGGSSTWEQVAVELCVSNPCVAASTNRTYMQRDRRGH